MPFDLQPTLNGRLVRLRPLRVENFNDLFAVASDPLLWEQHPSRDRYKEEVFRLFFQQAIESGGALLALDASTGEVIGTSRFHSWDAQKRQVVIGWTFLARSHWGGEYNRDMKHQMMQHAFRFVDRILFLIAPENIRSRRAIEKIGGLFLGIRTNTTGAKSAVYQITAPVDEHTI